MAEFKLSYTANEINEKLGKVDNKLDTSKLPEAINEALAQAKANGQFDGKDGKDGYTPIKGVDYFDGKDGADGKDGYTPVKNVDYFDGKDGTNGADGKTPVKGEDYFTDADKQEIVNDVLAQVEIPSEDDSTSINVTAEVGQSIVVKEVDENGKPTEWEAVTAITVEHQTLTEEQKAQVRENIGVVSDSSNDKTELFPTTNMSFYADEANLSISMFDWLFVDGETYTIVYNGEEYTCVASDMMVGNKVLTDSTLEDTGEPFVIMNDGLSIATMAPSLTAAPEYKIYHDGTLIHESGSLLDNNGVYMEFNLYVLVQNNTTYYVDFDGVEYECKPYITSDSVYLGNLAIMDGSAEDTGEPFILYGGANGTDDMFVIMACTNVEHEVDTFNVHTLRICEEVVKLELPEITSDDEGKVLSVKDGVPSWEETGMTTVLTDFFSETLLDGFVENGDYGFIYISQPPLFVFEDGKTYTVFWDGEQYDVTAYFATMSGMGDFIAVGNGAAMGYPGNNEPFVIATSENRTLIFALTDSSISHTIRICLPESVPAPTLPVVTTTDNGKVLQVVDGVWTAVTIADSSIKTYIDEYIGSVLEGDY